MELEDLYALIPDMICDPGCTLCCRDFGVPSRTALEQKRLVDYAQAHGIVKGPTYGNTCPYVTERGCAVHPARPLICRLYGVSPNYPCVLGIKPVCPLHEDEETEIFRLYYENFA